VLPGQPVPETSLTPAVPAAAVDTPPSDASRTKQTSRAPVDLVIGLDFGTAATKVVIRSPYLPGQRAAAVSFGELGHTSSAYLLPSRVRVCPDGRLSLRGDIAGDWAHDLKVPLLQPVSSALEETSNRPDATWQAVGYLALTLREARARILIADRDIYARFEPRWALNLGIPSAGYDDEAIRRRFLRVARAAWRLSWLDGRVTRDGITELLRHADDEAFDAGIAIEVVPEVAAQAVGYARSTLRDPGLHLLIDVGATTFDVCGFVLHDREGQDRYELLTASVDWLGALMLHRRRLDALKCPNRDRGIMAVSADPLMPVHERLSDYHPGCSCDTPDMDSEFRTLAANQVMHHLMGLRQRRHPFSRRWETGLPVFLCGGGSNLGIFRGVVAQAHSRFCSVTTTRGLLLRTLPRPEHLVNEDIDDGLFHRLSVAYGLSFESFDIGGISPPYENPDISPRRRRDPGDRFVSKDQV
jgi:hypothetical protein